MFDEQKKLSQKVKSWSVETVSKLQQQFDRLNIIHRADSKSFKAAKDSLESKVRNNKEGVVSRVGFTFPRHMVFVHKGVGKGTPISKQGTTNRKAKEWFNDPMDKQVENLGDIVAESCGDMVVNNLKIK